MSIYVITEESTTIENNAPEIHESYILGFRFTKRGANRFINKKLLKTYQFIVTGIRKKVPETKITCSKNPLMTVSLSWGDDNILDKKKVSRMTSLFY